ncbi:MAG: hypothetical protein AAF682_03980 [Planctomycetota bacterium]
MPAVVLDDFTDSTLWSSSNPAQLALVDDTGVHAGFGDASVRVEASATAGGEFFERTVAAVDLSALGELRLWYRSSVVADGSTQAPFQLQLELGSAALPVGAPGNDWLRYLPAFQGDRFEFVRLALDDLDPQVATALDTLRFTVVPPAGDGVSWTAWLDGLLACRPQLVVDVNAALVAALHNNLTLGAPVPAQVHAPGAAEPTAPWLRLVHYDALFSDPRTTAQRTRTDFTETGYRLSPESVAYDLDYRIEPVTADPLEHAEMVEFVLNTLGPRGTLPVLGTELPVERLGSHKSDAKGDSALLRYRVRARQDRGLPVPVTPVGEVALETEQTT